MFAFRPALFDPMLFAHPPRRYAGYQQPRMVLADPYYYSSLLQPEYEDSELPSDDEDLALQRQLQLQQLQQQLQQQQEEEEEELPQEHGHCAHCGHSVVSRRHPSLPQRAISKRKRKQLAAASAKKAPEQQLTAPSSTPAIAPTTSFTPNESQLSKRELPNVLALPEELSRPMTWDVKESEKAVEVQAALPGVKADQVDVSVDHGRLSVRAKRSHRDAHMRFEESFVRHVLLPENVDAQSISAELNNGVLRVRIPKPEVQPVKQPTKIAIRDTEKALEKALEKTSPAPEKKEMPTTNSGSSEKSAASAAVPQASDKPVVVEEVLTA